MYLAYDMRNEWTKILQPQNEDNLKKEENPKIDDEPKIEKVRCQSNPKNWGPPIYNTLNIQIRHFYVSAERLFKNNKDSIQMQKNHCWKLLNYSVLCCMKVILASTYHYSLLLQFKEKQLAGAKLWKLCQLNTFSGKLEIFAKFF